MAKKHKLKGKKEVRQASRKRPKQSVKEGKAMRPPVFPAHLDITPAEWRGLKRTEWLEVRQALERYYQGSMYTPAKSAFYKIGVLAEQVTEALAADDWVAW